MWETYKDDAFVKTITGEILPYPSFCRLLCDVFPNVSSQYKSVTGKCDVCESLRAKMICVRIGWYSSNIDCFTGTSSWERSSNFTSASSRLNHRMAVCGHSYSTPCPSFARGSPYWWTWHRWAMPVHDWHCYDGLNILFNHSYAYT